VQVSEAQVAGLRVAVVHSFYRSHSPSGENQAVLAQTDALARAGHRTHLLAAHTDELSRAPLYPLRTAATVATGRGRSPLAELRRLRPDVVHVHNLFPNFGRSWLRRWHGCVVATVHNYRPLCAAGTLYRDGSACTRCPDGDRWAGLRHGCYRDSRVATAPLAWAGRRGVAADPLLQRAQSVVVLSETSRQVYLRAGIAPERLALVPNFTSAPAARPGFAVSATATADPAKSAWVVAGRLSAEKGVLELLRGWPTGQPLDVVGDGPLLEECRSIAPPSVRFLGALDHPELRRRLPSWRGLVFPSRCLEGAPMIYPEALAAGLPVLAFAGSSVADCVHEHSTGAVVEWSEPLEEALIRATERFPAQRAHCRSVFARYYTEEAWAARIAQIYTAAAQSRVAATRTDNAQRPAQDST
jgi:glycosyltransferase involved in cell wall biosynthesis